MKKILKSTMTLTLILILLVSACAFETYAQEINNGVAINEENFPDANFRNFLLNGSYYIWDESGNMTEIVYDANKDGYLCESEIANIRQLQIQQSPITDLTGLDVS